MFQNGAAPFQNGCPILEFQNGAAPFQNGADSKMGHNLFSYLTRGIEILLQTYLPGTRQTEGVHGFDNGFEYYKSLLYWHLSIHMDPKEVHNLGLKEVARIKQKMESVSCFMCTI